MIKCVDMNSTKAILCFTLLLALSGARAAELDHDHLRLTADPKLTLSELVTRTLAQTPSLRELESQADYAAAWNERAANWLSAAPALELHYQTDRFNHDQGLAEYEAGLELPLWRWGERSAHSAFARRLAEENTTARAQLRWEVAGAVREALWQVAEAEVDHVLAQRAAELAGRVLEKMERAHELGDAALGEVLIARSNRLQALNDLIDKDAALMDAERSYAILTQESVRPAFTAESLSNLQELPSDHVLVTWLNSQVQRASAARDRIEKSSRGSPTLLLGPKRERSPNDPANYDSIGLTVRVPFATGRYAGPDIAAADRLLAGTIAERDRQLRRLRLMFHEASHQMMVVTDQLAAAAESAVLAEQQIEMGSLAYESGELNLLNLLQIQSSALAAERHAALLAVAKNRAIARYNQSVGETP